MSLVAGETLGNCHIWSSGLSIGLSLTSQVRGFDISQLAVRSTISITTLFIPDVHQQVSLVYLKFDAFGIFDYLLLFKQSALGIRWLGRWLAPFLVEL